MTKFRNIPAASALAAGLLIAANTVALAGPNGFGPAAFHDSEFGDLRGLVDRAQSDLRNASDLGHGDKQRDRYHKAQDHLSKLDKSLSHGKYNKGALNDSIDGIKSILDHNTLQVSARDALMRDLTDLKIARDRH